MARSLRVLAVLLALAALPAHAQQYNRFGPANGILKGVTTSPQTSAAVAADVSALWSGTCNAASFLRGDGACAAPAAGTPAGSTTQVQFNNAGAFGASAGFTYTDSTHTLLLGITGGSTANNGKIQTPDGKALVLGNSTNSTTASGGTVQLAGQSNSFLNGVGGGATVTGGSGLNGGNGGEVDVTGGSSTAANGAPVVIAGGAGVSGTGTGGAVHIVGGLDSGSLPSDVSLNATFAGALIIKGATGEWDLGSSADPGTAGYALKSGGPGAPPVWAAVSGGGCTLANPTGTIGLTAVNGSASTCPRSDSAPALSQGIAPTWVGAHTFTPAGGVVGVTINAGTANYGEVINAAANAYGLLVQGSATASQSFGPSIRAGTNGSDTALDISDTTNTTSYFHVAGDGILSGSDYASSGSFTGTLTGMASATTLTVNWYKSGKIVQLITPSGTVGTSNANTFQLTGIPVGIRPVRTQQIWVCALEDNSVTNVCGLAEVGISGTSAIDFTLGVVSGSHMTGGLSGGWTATGAKGLTNGWTVSYQIQ